MPSVRDIAKQAGVSITTVSRVLNNHPSVSAHARQKVLKVVNTSGNGNASHRSMDNIALVYTGESSMGSAFDAALTQGIACQLEVSGYDLMVINAQRAREEGETFTQMFQRKGIRGAVIRTTTATRWQCLEIARESFPAVVVADRFDEPEVSFIRSDASNASRRAMEMLLNLGHRQIAVVTNVVDDHDHAERLESYHQALREAGVDCDPRLVVRVPAYIDGGTLAFRQIQCMNPKPTAVFVIDPYTSLGLVNEAMRSGIRVPDDLSIVGFNDAPQHMVTFPQLTTVAQDAEVLGREAFNMLQVLLRQTGQMQVARKTLECWLEVHETTAAPGQPVNASKG